jgi:acetyl esterase/lipase
MSTDSNTITDIAAAEATAGSRHLVDPALLELLQGFAPVELTEEVLSLVRANEFPLPRDPDIDVTTTMTTLHVPGPAGTPDVPLTVYRPAGNRKRLPCLYHIHGGGYVAGSAHGAEPIMRPLALQLECVVVSVDYRLAPETRFPGAIEDCYAGLQWVFANAGELGIDPSRIGVTGESAGGGLAAALALLARDRAQLRLTFQHLIYPMIDDRTCTRSDPHPYTGEFVWTHQNNAFGWQALLGVPPGGDGVSPYAAAARATDLSKLPPTYISTATLDLFLEENLDYARRLTRAGVPVELHVYPGAYHGFDFFAQAPVSLAARRTSVEALRRALHPAR